MSETEWIVLAVLIGVAYGALLSLVWLTLSEVKAMNRTHATRTAPLPERLIELRDPAGLHLTQWKTLEDARRARDARAAPDQRQFYRIARNHRNETFTIIRRETT